MAKQKGPQGIPNKHIYSRASYLYQAANLLATSASATAGRDKTAKQDAPEKVSPAIQRTSRRLLEDMRSVSLKAQIRQSRKLKQSICKFCNTLLVEGQTCHSRIDNASNGGKKPWADILVMKCGVCGGVKRYPVSAPKQVRKGLRDQAGKGNTKDKGPVDDKGNTSMGDETRE